MLTPFTTWLRGWNACAPTREHFIGSAVLSALLVLSETYHVALARANFAYLLGGTLIELFIWYLLLAVSIGALAAVLVRRPLAPALAVALVFYGLISVKVLAIDATFLSSSTLQAAFFGVSLVLFAGCYLLYRLIRSELVFSIFIVAFLNGLKWVRMGWNTQGGKLSAFLADPETISRLVPVVVGFVGACVFILVVRRHLWRGLLAVALIATAAGGVVRHSVMPQRSLSRGAPGPDSQPDLYVLSFDALRKDVVDEACRGATSQSAWFRFCKQGTHYENVISSGLQTYSILRKNIGASKKCGTSLPGKLGKSGYASAMFFGSKMRAIAGWQCFDQYYSGDGRQLMNQYMLPSIVHALGPEAPRLRAKFVDSKHVLSALESAAGKTDSPLFAYLHLLDLHAPYVPEAQWYDDDYLSNVVPEFMARCYLNACKFDDAEDAKLIERSKAAYFETLEDVQRHISRLFKIAEARGRPFRIVLTADHGELFGEHGGFAHGGGFVPELLHLPFIVYDSEQAKLSRDCTLLGSPEAISLALGLTQKSERQTRRKRLTMHGRPLGKAIADLRRAKIDYSVHPKFLKHRNSWRNVHPKSKGSVAWEPGRCEAGGGEQ